MVTRREYATPPGTSDALFARCALAGTTVRALTEGFERRGYREVKTPLIEYYDVFTRAQNTLDPRYMYKLTDGGDILVVRPDSTTPIGRLVASKLQKAPLPLRIYYNQDVLRFTGDSRGSRAQTRQCGIELIGAQGLRSELEIAQTAISSLAGAGLRGFKLELGHAGIYRSLAGEISFRGEDAELVRRLVETKNYSAVNDVLNDYSAEYPRETAALRELPKLFGGSEVFDEAQQLFTSPAAIEPLLYLKKVYEALCYIGLGECAMLDLGLVNRMEYYTGIILSGYAEGSGEQVLSGGRYDAMYGRYGMNVSATGFAINVDAVCDALESPQPQVPDAMLCYDARHAREAYARADELRAQGLCIELSTAGSRAESLRQAREKHIRRLICVDGTGDELETGGAE